MMRETPEISNDIKKYLQSKNYPDQPILKNHSNFQNCFVYLHPFLQIVNEQDEQIMNWSNKFEIERTCVPVTWNEILKLSKLKDIQSLDRCLAFYHRAYRFAEKTEYSKLRDLLEKRLDLIPPQVDELPGIIENKLLKTLLDLGYESVFIYQDISSKDKLYETKNLLANSHQLPSHVRIETPDSKF